MPYTFAQLSDVDYLISDDMLPESVQKAVKEAGIRVI